MTSPVLTVSLACSIEEAARLMGESGLHHLLVVGTDGRAEGMVSSLDLVRALVGLPARHPSTFPHYDTELDVVWADPQVFDRRHVASAPDGAGVLVLSAGGRQFSESDLWVEASTGLRARLGELLDLSQPDAPALAQILARKDLRFRCALVGDEQTREVVASRMRARVEAAPLPRDVDASST
jgi:CBS domain-containing protein